MKRRIEIHLKKPVRWEFDRLLDYGSHSPFFVWSRQTITDLRFSTKTYRIIERPQSDASEFLRPYGVGVEAGYVCRKPTGQAESYCTGSQRFDWADR